MNIDYTIVLLYLILTIFVGLWKTSKISNLKEYALGSQNYSNFVVVATIFASFIGGGATIGIIEQIHQTSLIFGTIFFGQVIQKIIIAKFIAPNLNKFKGSISSGDLLATAYGDSSKRFTGIIAFIISGGMVAAQVSGIGYVLEYYIGMTKEASILIGGGIVITYSVIGGMRSVIATDVFQFFILITAFPLICNLGLSKIGGYQALFDSLPSKQISLPSKKDIFINILPLLVYFSIPFEAMMAQRLLLAKNPTQVKKTMYSCAAIETPFVFVVALIGLIGVVLFPNIESKQVFPHLINEILPVGFKGFAIAGILAVIMSTADSNLNTASISFANDIYNPKDINSKKVLNLAKLATLVCGVFSIVVSLYFKDIISIIFSTLSVWSATVMIPLFMCLIGKKIKTIQFNILMFIGVLTIIICHASGYENHTALIGTIVSILGFAGFYYFNKKSHAKNETSSRSKKNNFSIKKLVNHISLSKLGYFIEKEIQEYGAQYKTFGGFVIISFILPLVMWNIDANNPHNYLTVMIKIFSALIAFGLIIHESWPKQLKRYLPYFWYFSIFLILPFSSVFFLIANHGHLIWWFSLAISIYLVTMLLDWISSITVIVIGLTLGALFGLSMYGWNYDLSTIVIDKDQLVFDIVYLMVVSSIVGVVFSRNKGFIHNQIIQYQNKINQNLEKIVKSRTSDLANALEVKNSFLRNISHELRTPLHNITNISDGLVDNWNDYSSTQKAQYISLLNQSANSLKKYMENMINLSKYESAGVELDVQRNNLNSLLKKIAADKDVIIKSSKTIFKKFDIEKISMVIDELIQNAFRYKTDNSPVVIKLTDKFVSFENTASIPRDEHLKVFDPFFESRNTASKSGGKGLGLALVKAIVNAHGWSINLSSTSKKVIFKINF